ncbi:uncharacterized protein [Solanum lycopersicum]|uniref:uncharacterized protein n=1 Tax=Solanum lycopersicum TaxID=4081 RepID=UPI0037496D11
MREAKVEEFINLKQGFMTVREYSLKFVKLSGMIMGSTTHVKDEKKDLVKEAHGSRYSIHPGSTKMYHDLKKIYWWDGMKKDIAEYVAKCPNCQQVMAEHLKPGVLTKIIETIESALEFIVGDQVYLKISPMKGVMRFCRKEKLSPWYVGPYEILLRVGEVAYDLALLAEVAYVHPVFHVIMLKKCLGDPASILRIEGLGVGEDLFYEEVPRDILDTQVKRLRNKEIAKVKVLWRNHLVAGATWEAELDMRSHYPHLFST